jgi:hypothetical protein
MQQTAPVAVHRQRIVGLVADRVRQLVADVGGRIVVEDSEQRAGEAGVAMVQEPEPPRAAGAVLHGREAVHAIRIVGTPSRARSSRIRSSVSWQGSNNAPMRAARSACEIPSLPAIRVAWLTVGIKAGTWVGRLQSITRRE